MFITLIIVKLMEPFNHCCLLQLYVVFSKVFLVYFLFLIIYKIILKYIFLNYHMETFLSCWSVSNIFPLNVEYLFMNSHDLIDLTPDWPNSSRTPTPSAPQRRPASLEKKVRYPQPAATCTQDSCCILQLIASCTL